MESPDSGIVFPYAITLSGGGAVAIVPVAALGIKTRSGAWISFSLIIDSGATISALPRTDAELIGVNLARGKPVVIQGVGGTALHGWEHRIFIRCGTSVFRCPFVFLDADKAPRILGRLGVFDRYTVIFEESVRRTGLFPHRRSAHIVSSLFNDALNK